MLLGRACVLVPLGSAALKVGLASALAGAGAAAQTARLGELVARRARGGDSPAASDRLLGAAAGLVFGLSYAAAFQAVRPEVYALSALLVVSAALELARFDERGDRRRLYLAALWAGLALTNHHLLALALVGAAPFILIRRAALPIAPAIARVLTAGALGAATLAYLPLRALRHPLVDWGAPSTWPRLWWTLSAQAFQKSLARGQASDAGGVALALARELHPVGALLALGGAYVLLRLPGRRRLGLFLLGAALLDALAPALVGFDPQNPDAYGYLEAAVALLAALACALPGAVAGYARKDAARRASTGLAAALAASALALGATNFGRLSLARAHDAEATLGAFLDEAPPRATLVSSYFPTIFGLYYLRAVEGRRPDVALLHRHFLAYPGYAGEAVRAEPALAAIIRGRDVDPAALAAGPALVEYDLDLPDALVPASRVVAAADSAEPQAHRFAGWQAFLAAHRACRLRAPDFDDTLARARAMLGDAPELTALAARCR
jgi:Protein O-mannosyl-transferase TMEM260-like